MRGLLGHLLEVLQRVQALGRGRNPFGIEAPVEVAGGSWVKTWEAAANGARMAWDDGEAMDRTVTSPWVRGPGRVILGGYVSEVTVHTWDLARAIGFEPAWDEEVVSAAYAAIRDALPVAERQVMFKEMVSRLPEGMRGNGPPFADAVAVADAAPTIDRLVAWTGRRP